MVTRDVGHIVIVHDLKTFREHYPDAHPLVDNGSFYCTRCGDHYNPRQPCSFEMMRAMMDTFMDEHEECGEKVCGLA
jgi:cellobiose phosphorylase